MDRTALIGVPTSAGTHGPGQERAPWALRRAGLVRELEAAGVLQGYRALDGVSGVVLVGFGARLALRQR